ncbi:MAG: hypothetical protein WBM65_01110 [Sedimenticolaceae bacterium]
MTRGVLVDAGPLDAIPHRDDNDHQLCVDPLHKLGGPLLTTWTCLTEAMYLIVFGPGGASEILAVKPTTLASRIKRWNIQRPDAKDAGV